MQIDPSRVENIQQALLGAGAYHGAPTGRWDSETRDAMARYQESNGFGVTGQPDAKSLMKLGLGPHPLPSELDKSKALSTGAEPGTPLPAESTAPSSPDPAGPAQPESSAPSDPPGQQ